MTINVYDVRGDNDQGRCHPFTCIEADANLQRCRRHVLDDKLPAIGQQIQCHGADFTCEPHSERAMHAYADVRACSKKLSVVITDRERERSTVVSDRQ